MHVLSDLDAIVLGILPAGPCCEHESTDSNDTKLYEDYEDSKVDKVYVLTQFSEYTLEIFKQWRNYSHSSLYNKVLTSPCEHYILYL